MKATLRPLWPLVGLLPLILVVDEASGTQRPKLVELHPTAENIPEVTDPRFILRADPMSTFMDEAGYEKITIGVEDGEYHEMFGEVVSLALPGDGTVLVLDSENREVRVFDYDGGLLTTFGRHGAGPGEFRSKPKRISVADQGESVFVLTGSFVAAFDRRDSSTFTPKSKAGFHTDLITDNGCAMNGHYWVYGNNRELEGVLHKFTYDGELVASFLEHYKSPTENIRLILSGMGLMSCSEPHGIVALNRVNAPILTGYRENGEMAWQVKFDGFDPVHFREYERGGWSLDFPAAGQSMILSITTDPAGDFYVHYMTFDGRQPVSGQQHGPVFKIDAQTGLGRYLGHAQTGRGRYLGDGLDMLSIDSGYVFSATNTPFPQVVIHKPQAGAN